jgi:hypothetical protein
MCEINKSNEKVWKLNLNNKDSVRIAVKVKDG